MAAQSDSAFHLQKEQRVERTDPMFSELAPVKLTAWLDFIRGSTSHSQAVCARRSFAQSHAEIRVASSARPALLSRLPRRIRVASVPINHCQSPGVTANGAPDADEISGWMSELDLDCSFLT